MPALRDLSATEIATLCGILVKLRPHGAPRWQEAGVRAAFAKVANLDAANVLMAAIRLSQDRTAETPAQIGIPAAQCWVEKPGEWTAPSEPYDHGTACGVCDLPETRCRAMRWSGHEYEPKPTALATRIPGEHAGGLVVGLRDRAAKGQHVEVAQ